jgi:putative heme-binding domain-containing protein
VLPALSAWVKRLDHADPAVGPLLLEGLWTYQSLDVVEPDLLKTLLHAKDHRIRAAATRAIQYWHARIPHAAELLAERVVDPHPQVRLEAVRSLARIPDPRSVELALQVLDRPMDRFLDYALWLTVRELAPIWLPALQADNLAFRHKPDRLLFAMQALGSAEAVKPLVELYRGGKVAKEMEASVLTVVAAVGGPPELALVFEVVAAQEPADVGRQLALLGALEQSARRRGVRPAGDLKALGSLLSADNEAVRGAAARLTGLWKQSTLQPRLVDLARSTTASDALRRAAIDGLALFGDPACRQELQQLAGPENPMRLRLMALAGLASVDPETAARLGADTLAASSDGVGVAEVFAAFLERRNGATILSKALSGRKLSPDVAKIGIRTVKSTGRDSPALVAVLTQSGSLTAGLRVLTPDQMRQMVADVREHGDPARGEVVYRRNELTCMKCHAIAGAGGQVGPDLASIGASAPIDYLVESILEPNKAIKENYHTLVVATKDGRFVTGIKVRETMDELVLRDAEDREVSVPVGSIDQKANGKSLMPDGLADSLTRSELVDLVRFLSELGKVGPYSVSKARHVRRWQVLQPTDAARQFIKKLSAASVPSDHPSLSWSPAYSKVDGELPLDAIPAFKMNPRVTDSPRVGYARCQVDVTGGGKIKVLVDSTDGLALWIDGAPVEVKKELLLDFKTGLHMLVFAVDLNRRGSGLSCIVDELDGSPARVRIINGK